MNREDKAWLLGVEYGKKHRLADVETTEEMYQAALLAGCAPYWFDVFKYGAQSVWFKQGELKKEDRDV